VSYRSLRRQLWEQGISLRGLLDERMQIALRYLRTTRLANEDVALALGFNDAANFRRAFRRWTNKSPKRGQRRVTTILQSPTPASSHLELKFVAL
jgi:transcriptional regulator GlxA family with amidase domain